VCIFKCDYWGCKFSGNFPLIINIIDMLGTSEDLNETMVTMHATPVSTINHENNDLLETAGAVKVESLR